MGHVHKITKSIIFLLLTCFMPRINGVSLASTARTFIQDGSTTEYAEYVTKKSSRVLYGTTASSDPRIFSEMYTLANYIKPERIYDSNNSPSIYPKGSAEENLPNVEVVTKPKKIGCKAYANCTAEPTPSFAFHRNFSTVIYYGFADFTTMVGDSVIIYSPSEMNPLYESSLLDINYYDASESVKLTGKIENEMQTSSVTLSNFLGSGNVEQNNEDWKGLSSIDGQHKESDDSTMSEGNNRNDIIDSRTNGQIENNVVLNLINPSKVSNNLDPSGLGEVSSLNIINNSLESKKEVEELNNSENDLLMMTHPVEATVSSQPFVEIEGELRKHNVSTNSTEEEVESNYYQTLSVTNVDEVATHATSTITTGGSVSSSKRDMEIIYKTFYTVYTYFTTLFQSKTSTLFSQTDILSTIVISDNNGSNSSLVLQNSPDLNNDDFLQTLRLGSNEIDQVGNNLIQCTTCYLSYNSTNGSDDEDLTRLLTTYTFYTTIYSGSDTKVVAHSAVIGQTINNTVSHKAKNTTIHSEQTNMEANVQDINDSIDMKQIAASQVDDSPITSTTIPAIILPHPETIQSSNVEIEKPDSVDMMTISPSVLMSEAPSATVLVQTGFTTQTFFTTVYSGEKSDVFSHLETVTTTLTETYTNPLETDLLTNQPSPITYYTTFTFWTKLAVKGQITTISREEITSSVFIPNTMMSGIVEGHTLLPENNRISSVPEDPIDSSIEYAEYDTFDNVTATNLKRNRRSTDIEIEVEDSMSNPRKSRETPKSRFRRPRPIPETREEPSTKAPPPPTSKLRGRADHRAKQSDTSTSNSSGSNKRVIRPSHVSSNANSRSKFTLREKEVTATTERSISTPKRAPFRKPQTVGGIKSKRPSSTPSSQLLSGKRRLNNHSNNNEATSSRNTVSQRNRSSPGRSRGSSFRDSEARNRNRNTHESSNDVVELDKSGIITATHIIPGETYLPIINGKSTELKLIVTARTSTEVLGPQQYTKSLGANGQITLGLTSESSSVNSNGATEITHFLLREFPTTTITFTPTTIRGRKTSFSLVLPSTAYTVDPVVSTIQPQIQADTPLANILLSQLLLGNAGFPSNLLYGLYSSTPAQPTVEYVTRTSTYVTTLFEGKSTVLPITFQGKKILTTIYDTTAETITATEFITDTIVSTPTVQTQAPSPAVNSLLLQQLLFQQLHDQPAKHESLNINEAPLPQQFVNDPFPSVSDTGRDFGQHDSDDSNGILNSDVIIETSPERPKSRRVGKKHKRKHKEGSHSQDMSVITLYVSGKRPGEFSTILSTLQSDHSVHKRSLHTAFETSIDTNFVDHTLFEYENIGVQLKEATQSLTSIVGDVNKWYVEKESTFSAPIMPTFTAEFS
ncbi:uncharacterized protein LOC142232773 [Haematobia irritans]|uniref:uncharacterized protein LOC142232773 n=1 Tax=Haematobia irritans TaxID=7368 RepID=UPI003F5070EE